MSRSVTYEVGVTYCNDHSTKQDHDDKAEALREYTDLLAVALESAQLTEPGLKHIRLVTFIGFDERGQVVQHITSPIFECDDRVVA